MTKKISIIIPCYNSPKTIELVLGSVLDQSRFDLVEEIIVADSSDDGITKPMLERQKIPGLKVIHIGTRIMPAIGRNLGVRHSSGEILLFIDSDVRLASNYIENLMGYYEQGYKAGGGAVLLPQWQLWNPLAVTQYFLQFNEFTDAAPLKKKGFIPSCNIFCSRVDFEKTGGFPEIRASEDVLFCRALDKVCGIWFIPKLKIYHIFREAMKSALQNQFLIGKSSIIYRRRIKPGKWYYGSFFSALCVPGVLLIKTAKISFRAVTSGFELFFKFVIFFPLFGVGMLAWGMGLLEGCLTRE